MSIVTTMDFLNTRYVIFFFSFSFSIFYPTERKREKGRGVISRRRGGGGGGRVT
jgi:hypothetical protein